MKLALVVVLLAACAGTTPQTRYYQLASPPAHGRETSGAVLAVDSLAADGAYDDERMVYRVDPVRLDYYNYHRWSTTPGAMVSSYLQQALAGTGKFRSVVRDTTADTAVVLGGRVTAIEEVDESKTKWLGHVALELTLTDPRTSQILWSHSYDEREPLAAQTPEGLARAISTAMGRVVREAAPVISQIAEHEASVHHLTTPAVAGE
jgi:ABC-type uncharacterized transport system auxiliary subunit